MTTKKQESSTSSAVNAVEDTFTDAEVIVPEVMTDKELGGTPAGKEIAARRITDDQLRDLSDWGSIGVLAEAIGADIEDVTAYGTGFAVLDSKEKKQLVGQTFAIIDWSFHTGDMGRFVSAVLLVKDTNRKVIINDGSTGICQQLVDISKKRLSEGKDASCILVVPKGLRVSEYTKEIDGKPTSAQTFYIDFSPK